VAAQSLIALHDSVERWASDRLGSVESISFGDPVKLSGGVSGAERIDVCARVDGRDEKIALVRKRPPVWSGEIEALGLLREVDLDRGRVPDLIAEGIDDDGRWFLTPFYPGSAPQRRSMPDEVLSTLAKIHTHFAGAALEGVPGLDHAWWRKLLLEITVPQFERAMKDPVRSDDLATVAGVLCRWADDRRIEEALSILPTTLVHRDMHDGNVLAGTDGTTIVDWGNAGRGPAWIDLENIVARNDERHLGYVREWERLNGSQRDRKIDEIGWTWATVQVRAQYIGYPLSTGNVDRCLRMVREGEAALDALGAALG
jgi:hypothetical protein